VAIESGIAWTKSTLNPWVGCTKVGPGCDGCYAEALDKRMKFGGAEHWGPGVPRYRTSAKNWGAPIRWNKLAPDSEFAGRKGFWPVFCASLADVFDNEVPFGWRVDLCNLIRNTPNLSWLLVTKRIGNVASMVPRIWMDEGFPAHVRIMITVVNQEEADRDIPKLLALPCKNGISYEPALGPVDWTRSIFFTDERKIEWIICGGESSQRGHSARYFNMDWARRTLLQCRQAGVPFFMKQLGGHPVDNNVRDGKYSYMTKARSGDDPVEWPVDLRVREFPE